MPKGLKLFHSHTHNRKFSCRYKLVFPIERLYSNS